MEEKIQGLYCMRWFTFVKMDQSICDQEHIHGFLCWLNDMILLIFHHSCVLFMVWGRNELVKFSAESSQDCFISSLFVCCTLLVHKNVISTLLIVMSRLQMMRCIYRVERSLLWISMAKGWTISHEDVNGCTYFAIELLDLHYNLININLSHRSIRSIECYDIACGHMNIPSKPMSSARVILQLSSYSVLSQHLIRTTMKFSIWMDKDGELLLLMPL